MWVRSLEPHYTLNRSLFMTIRFSFLISFILFFLLLAPSPVQASETLWEFEDSAALSGWRFDRVTPRIKDGALQIEDGSFPVIYSPGRLNIPATLSVLTFRIKTNKPGSVKFSFYSAHTNFTYVLNFHIQASDDFHDYRIYLGDKIPGGEILYDFAFKLPGNKLDASIDSIGFHSPSKMELAGVLWDGFWTPEPIRVGTSNLVQAPRFGSFSMLTLLYIFVIISTIIFLIVALLRSGRFTREIFTGALVAGFALSAVLFTFRMDFNWLNVWASDRGALAGKSESERIRIINDGNYDSYFDFIDEMKTLVPEGEKIMPAARRVNEYDDHVARSVAYYLLPVVSSPGAHYMWLYFDETDRGVTYDAKLSTLKKGGDVVASDVRPVRLFGVESALYESRLSARRVGRRRK